MSWWRTVLNLPPTGVTHKVDRHGNPLRKAAAPPVGVAPHAASQAAGPQQARTAAPAPAADVRVATVPAGGEIPEGWEPWYGPEPDEVVPGQPVVVEGLGRVVPEFLETEPNGRQQIVETPAPDPERPEAVVPWQPVAVRRPTTVWQYVARGALILVIGYIMLTGLREILWPDGFGGKPAGSSGTNAAANFPAGEASQVAARFTLAYLSWDERDKDGRAAAIGRDLAKGLDTGVGWNGQGVQKVRGVFPGAVDVTDARTAHVIVLAEVVPHKGSGVTWTAQRPVWLRLSVPVEVGAGRVVVVGQPALVPDAPGDASERASELPTADDALTAATKPDARAFFEAYASSDEATAAIAAPQTAIRSLRGTAALKELKAWTVDSGDADRRTARATVTWKYAGTTAELDQDYRLTLLRTSAANGSERWQVAELANN